MYPIIPVVLCAMCVSGIGAVNHIAQESYGVNLPFFVATVFYGLLTCFLFTKRSTRNVTKNIFGIFASGLCDCVGSYFSVASLEFTSISSFSLLSGLQLQFGMVFSFLILKSKFSLVQIISLASAVVFSGLFTGFDFQNDGFVGDLLVICASLSYGFGCTLIERYKGSRDFSDYMSKMGLSALFTAVILTWAFNFNDIRTAPWQALLLEAASGVCSFFYVLFGFPLVKDVNAIFYMLPNVVAPLFSVPIDCIFFKTKFKWYQILIGIGVLASVVLYCWESYRNDEKYKAKEEQRRNADADKQPER